MMIQPISRSWRMPLPAACAIVAAFVIVSPAVANPVYFVSVDEWGKGFICDSQGSTPTVPMCNVIAGVGSFAALPSGFTNDPSPGGANKVLTYLLPFSIGSTPEDVYMNDMGGVDNDWDVLRFIGNELLFYSAQSPGGTVDCTAAPFVPNSGCDGLADKPATPPLLPLSTVIPEVGPVGDASGLFVTMDGGELVEFNFQSDELTKCTVPNCGPMSIAPPSTNPTENITGLPGPNGGQPFGNFPLPVGINNNPLTQVPEPSPAWLVGAGLVLFPIAWRARIRRTFYRMCRMD